MDFFLCVIGMMMILEGFPFFMFPDKAKMILEKALEIPSKEFRKCGFVMMILGLACVYLGRR